MTNKKNLMKRLAVLACVATMSLTSMSLTTEALGNQTITTAVSTALSRASSSGSSFTSKQVTMKSEYTCTTDAIRINWNKVSGATGYRIYRYNATTKKWVKLTTIKNGNTTTYRNSGLPAGSKYRYKVKAYKKVNGVNYWGKASAEKIVTTKPKQVTMKASTATKNAIRLNWTKVKCDGYKVYQKVGNSYKLIATIRDSDKTTYRVNGKELLTDDMLTGGGSGIYCNVNFSYSYDMTKTDALASGTKYTFKVRAYRKDTTGGVNYGKCAVKVKTTSYDMSNKFDKYIANNIKSSMSTYEKLCVLCKYPCSYSYNNPYNCYNGAAVVCYMAKKLGFVANTYTYSSGEHSEATIYANGYYYVCNVGHYGSAPRTYTVTKMKKLVLENKNITNDFWNAISEYPLIKSNDCIATAMYT